MVYHVSQSQQLCRYILHRHPSMCWEGKVCNKKTLKKKKRHSSVVWFHGHVPQTSNLIGKKLRDVRGIERRKGKSSRLGQPFSITINQERSWETPGCHGFDAGGRGPWLVRLRLGSMQKSKWGNVPFRLSIALFHSCILLVYLTRIPNCHSLHSCPVAQRLPPMAQWVNNTPAMQETQEIQVLSLGWEDSPEEGNGKPLQYSCLGSPMDRGAWRATVMGLQRVWHD